MFHLMLVATVSLVHSPAPDSITRYVIRHAVSVQTLRLHWRGQSELRDTVRLEPAGLAVDFVATRPPRAMSVGLARRLSAVFSDEESYAHGGGMWCISPPTPAGFSFRFKDREGRQAWVTWHLPIQTVRVSREGDRTGFAESRLGWPLVVSLLRELAPELVAEYEPFARPAPPPEDSFKATRMEYPVSRPRWLGPLPMTQVPPGPPIVVMLDVMVRPDGSVEFLDIIRQPASARDSAVADVVRHSRFEPGVGRDGKPIRARVSVSVTVP